MTHPALIAIGLGLLCFPLWLLRPRLSRLAGFDQRAWPRGRNLVLAIVDVARASAGVKLLLNGLPGLERIPALGSWQEAAFMAAAVLLGLLVQTLVWRDEDFVFAPVPYMLGLVIALAHPIVLVIALPLAVGSGMAIRAWAAGILGSGIGLAVVGLAVTQQDWRMGLLCGVVFCVPVLISALAGRHMGWPRK